MSEKIPSRREQRNSLEFKEQLAEYKEEQLEGLDEVVPSEDLHSAEELVVETNEALVEVKEKQRRRFIDERTQLPRVGGKLGAELRAAVSARREADKFVNSEQHYEITVPKWREWDKHINNIGKMIADALEKGGGGYDFRTALPYRIGHIGGVEMVFWPKDGSLTGKTYPTEKFKQTIEQFLPDDSKWMSGFIVSSVVGNLFPQEEKK